MYNLDNHDVCDIIRDVDVYYEYIIHASFSCI